MSITRKRIVDVFPIEIALEREPGIRRVALVQHDSCTALFAVITGTPGARIIAAIHEQMTAQHIDRLELHITRALPTDRRHNSKIDRPALRQRLARGQSPHTVLTRKLV
jgi:olefin beta-lactone synthetase